MGKYIGIRYLNFDLNSHMNQHFNGCDSKIKRFCPQILKLRIIHLSACLFRYQDIE